jgi:uncharacterized membrane protein YwzB
MDNSNQTFIFRRSIKKKLTTRLLLSIIAGISIIMAIVMVMFYLCYLELSNATAADLIDIYGNQMKVLGVSKQALV